MLRQMAIGGVSHLKIGIRAAHDLFGSVAG
jgi:hypothetical protein